MREQRDILLHIVKNVHPSKSGALSERGWQNRSEKGYCTANRAEDGMC